MQSKIKQNNLAIKLRKQGKTYSEILKTIPVAKSTLSIWLRDVGLAKPQRQRITKKRAEAQKLGAKARYEQRVNLVKSIKSKAKKEINRLNDNERWLLGIMLYWCEGSKQKRNNISASTQLGNSDPEIIRLFLHWLEKYCNIARKDIVCNLHIHTTGNIEKSLKYWQTITKLPFNQFRKTILKKHNPKTNRKFNADYKGLLKVTVKKSTNLNRKIMGWVEGIIVKY